MSCQLVPLGKGSRGADFWMANHDHVVLATSSDARSGECLTREGKYAVLDLTPACFISSVYKIRPAWMSDSGRTM